MICAGGISLIMIGAPKDKLLCGWRKIATKIIIRTLARIGLFFMSFVWIKEVYDDVDYSEWLGKNYKTKTPKTRAPIIISNHQSWSV